MFRENLGGVNKRVVRRNKYNLGVFRCSRLSSRTDGVRKSEHEKDDQRPARCWKWKTEKE